MAAAGKNGGRTLSAPLFLPVCQWSHSKALPLKGEFSMDYFGWGVTSYTFSLNITITC